jgi:hypothetical protein
VVNKTEFARKLGEELEKALHDYMSNRREKRVQI